MHRADETLTSGEHGSQIVVLAGVLGLEPRLTGPEPVGLPITPYPMGSAHPESLWASGRTEGQRYTNALAATNRGGVTYAVGATGGAVLLRSPIRRATKSTSTRKTPFCVIVRGSCHQDASETLRVLSSWLRTIATPKASRLFRMCSAMPASRPPTRITMRPAIIPKANRSKNSGKFWTPWASANRPEVTNRASVHAAT